MDVTKALNALKEHVEAHSNNKYQASPINSDKPLKQPIFTLLTADKYLARYLSKSGEKINNTQDLLKACHMILFEIENRLTHE
jgi:hypothetical protein